MANTKLCGYMVKVMEHRTGKVHVKEEIPLTDPTKVYFRDPERAKEFAEERKKELMASWPQERYLVYVSEILA